MNENYYNEIEKNKIIAFCADKVMFEAVKKGVLVGTFKNGVAKPGEPFDSMRNWAIHILRDGDQKTNEQVGAELRASVEALNFTEAGFEKLKEVKVAEKKEKKGNDAV